MKKASFLLSIICLACIGCNTYAQPGNMTSQPKDIQMKQFSILVRVPDTYSSEQAKLVGPQWDKQLEKWKAEGSYVLSFAFPGESHTVSGPEKVVKKESVLSGNLRVVSNIVLQAETLEGALELAKGCPILAYGGTVEVREIPKQIELKK